MRDRRRAFSGFYHVGRVSFTSRDKTFDQHPAGCVFLTGRPQYLPEFIASLRLVRKIRHELDVNMIAAKLNFNLVVHNFYPIAQLFCETDALRQVDKARVTAKAVILISSPDKTQQQIALDVGLLELLDRLVVVVECRIDRC